MNILYITPKIPYPLSDGGKLRAFNQIKHLSIKHKVTSLSCITDKKQLKGIEELKKYCTVETILQPVWKSWMHSLFCLWLSRRPLRVAYFKSKHMRKKAKALTKLADAVIIQELRMAQYTYRRDKTILEIVDTPSLQTRREIEHATGMWKHILRIELPRLARYEKRLAAKFKHIFVASKDDQEALGAGRIMKNGTDVSVPRRIDPGQNNIMFLGNFDYAPNVDAVKWFVAEIFPEIQKQFNDVNFFVVGRNPEQLQELKSFNIDVTGYVDNPGEYFKQSAVFVAPMRLGSGIQNKVLEALNNGVPVVATSIVNKGIEAKEGSEILTADTAPEFAQKVIYLLKNKMTRVAMSKSGKALVSSEYSWDKVNSILDSELSKIARAFPEVNPGERKEKVLLKK
jgi:glycosyltransferase involved in cell wall biosynthesis